MDLVELTASLSAAAPKARRIAVVSARSPNSVEVACAFTYCTCRGSTAHRCQRLGHGLARALAVSPAARSREGIAAHAEADDSA
jgi:hypothetical protein